MKLTNIFKKREIVRKIHFDFVMELDEDDASLSDEEYAEKYGKWLANQIGMATQYVRKKNEGFKWSCKAVHYYK